MEYSITHENQFLNLFWAQIKKFKILKKNKYNIKQVEYFMTNWRLLLISWVCRLNVVIIFNFFCKQTVHDLTIFRSMHVQHLIKKTEESQFFSRGDNNFKENYVGRGLLVFVSLTMKHFFTKWSSHVLLFFCVILGKV